VYFVHQSAKDFLLTKACDEIFPSGMGEVHHAIFSKSLNVLSTTLQRDIFGLGIPGFPINEVKRPNPDPLAVAQYSCIYWVDHLCSWDPKECTNQGDDLKSGGAVDKFLREIYLYWLEALSLLRSMSEGVISIAKLEVYFVILLSRKMP
jgi:hypothetical protein